MTEGAFQIDGNLDGVSVHHNLLQIPFARISPDVQERLVSWDVAQRGDMQCAADNSAVGASGVARKQRESANLISRWIEGCKVIDRCWHCGRLAQDGQVKRGAWRTGENVVAAGD